MQAMIPTEAHMRARRIAYENHFLYELQMCHVLPSVKLNHCLLELILSSDAAEDVDEFRQRNHDWIAVLAWIGDVVGLASLFVEQGLFRTILGSLHLVLSLPNLVLVLATYNTDLVKLIIQFWQFWLLMTVSLLVGLTFAAVLRDARASTGIVFFLTMLTFFLGDANTKSRSVFHFFMLASWPLLTAMFFAVLLHGAKAAAFTSFPIMNVQVADSEFLLHAGFILSTYALPRLVDSWSWLRNTGKRNDVKCLSIKPHHEIINVSSTKHHTAARNVEGDLCGQRPITNGFSQLAMTRLHPTSVDSRKTMLHPFKIPPPGYLVAIPWLGYVGVTVLVFALLLMRCDFRFATNKLQRALGLMALAFSLVFSLSHAMWCQRSLLRLLTLQVDWILVTVEFTLLTLCACDILRWNHRALICATVYVWHHWYLYQDTLPPITKSVLRCRIWFRTTVQVLLLLYLVVMAQWLFVSQPIYDHGPETLQNRVLIDVAISKESSFRVRCVGLFVTNLVVHFFWMLRGIWRQVMLRPNTFRVMQSKVHFSLGLPTAKTSPIRRYLIRGKDGSNHTVTVTKSITRASTMRSVRSWVSTKVLASNS